MPLITEQDLQYAFHRGFEEGRVAGNQEKQLQLEIAERCRLGALSEAEQILYKIKQRDQGKSA